VEKEFIFLTSVLALSQKENFLFFIYIIKYSIYYHTLFVVSLFCNESFNCLGLLELDGSLKIKNQTNLKLKIDYFVVKNDLKI